MRRYGKWAWNEGGDPEDPTHCIKEVWPRNRYSFIPHQCQRKRGYGLNAEYCQQHAKNIRSNSGSVGVL